MLTFRTTYASMNDWQKRAQKASVFYKSAVFILNILLAVLGYDYEFLSKCNNPLLKFLKATN